MGAEVFISYSSLDRDRVMPVVDSLRGNGISVWVDEGNIHAADLWSEQIVQAIADCHVMVVMLSQNSTDSHNVVKEVMLASEQKKALLPVYLESADIPAKLQYQLAGIQHLELYGQDKQIVLNDLANGLAKLGVRHDDHPCNLAPTTVKRHEKPISKTSYFAKSNSYANSAIAFLVVIVASLLGLLLFKSGKVNRSLDYSDRVYSQTKQGRVHLKISLPEDYPLVKPTEMPFGVVRRNLAISPNGKHVVYVCFFKGERYLCLRNLGDDSFKLLNESKGGLLPFFSPDSKWVGFATSDSIKKIELSSGLLKIICHANNPYSGATWSSNGEIYFGNSEGVNFCGVNENGGEPYLITDKIFRVFNPSSTPDGSGILFRASGVNVSRGPTSIFHIQLDSGNITRIGNGVTPEFLDEKNLITVEDSQLRLTEINLQALSSVGESKTLAKSKILTQSQRYGAQYSISDSGILVFLKGVYSPLYQLTILDTKTNEAKALVDKKEVFGQYSISPDSQRIAIEVVRDQISDIHILDRKRSRFNSFAQKRHNYTPKWSPDGEKIYYTSNRNDPTFFDLYVYDFQNGTEKKIDLEDGVMRVFNISDISEDGKRLLCFGSEIGSGLNELYVVDVFDGKKLKLTNNQITEWGGVLSKDEKWIAYTSEKDMEGSYAIYINSFPEMDRETRISAGGGEEPKWLPDGSGVYYRNGSKWMKVSLQLDQDMEIGEPELFFEGDYVNVWGPSHDIFADGRILLLKGEKWQNSNEIDVIINALDVEP